MQKKITRKQFFGQALGIAGAVAGIATVAACSDDDDDDGAGNGTGGSGGAAGGAAGSGGAAAGNGGAAGTAGGGGGGADVSMCESDVETVNLHTHEVTVPAADVNAGAEMTFMLSDVGGHTHTVTLTADDMTTLAGGSSVMKQSSEDGTDPHMHMVTVTCS